MRKNRKHILMWAEALESDEFKQGMSVLREETRSDDDQVTLTHCCLGVACEVYLRATKKGHWDHYQNFVVGNDACSTEWIVPVAKYFGTGDDVRTYILNKNNKYVETMSNFIDLNDTKKIPFSLIAKILREPSKFLVLDGPKQGEFMTKAEINKYNREVAGV